MSTLVAGGPTSRPTSAPSTAPRVRSESSERTNRTCEHRAMLRYRLEFVGPGDLPRPDYVFRDTPICEGTVELYGATRYVVVSVLENVDLPVALLRKVLA